MSSPRNALGRGLGALIPNAAPAVVQRSAAAESAPSEISVAQIGPNPDQPRRVFDAEQLERLADSIRVHGVLQPVVVRRVSGASDRYELVVGERRWRASQLAGLDAIPAIVADIDPADRLEVALVENVQRRDLNPIELGVAFQALADTGATQEEIGRRVGFDRSTIANHLRLLDLPRNYQEDVEAGRLSTGHAKALLQVTNLERRHQLRDRIVRDGLSVRATEELARPAARPRQPRAAPSAADPQLQRLADALRARLQTRVRIHGGAERGRIEIEYYGAEDLSRLAELMQGDAQTD
jgi:ParB family transcriptional regulator, chromosome partitioning protein